MTIADLGAIAEMVGAAAVVVTLIFLALQVRQANLLAKAQARQRMMEHIQIELYQFIQHPDLHSYFDKRKRLSDKEHVQLHFFLLAAMRQRESEWCQFKDGVIPRDIYQAYHEVISLHLGTQRTRQWWAGVGRVGFNPAFVAEVDAFIANRPLNEKFYEDITSFDSPSPDGPAPTTSGSAAARAPRRAAG